METAPGSGPDPEIRRTPPTPTAEQVARARERAERTGGASLRGGVEAATPPVDPNAPTEVMDTTATSVEAADPIETDDPELLAKIEQSRDHYAALRLRERSQSGSLLKKSGELSQDLAEARQQYEELLHQYAIDQVNQRLSQAGETGARKYSDGEVALEAALHVYEELNKLAEREAALTEVKGPWYKEAYTKLKHSHKTRIAIGLGLAGVAAGVGLATGGTGFLVATSAAKIAWRGASGYLTGEGLQGIRQGKKISKNIGQELADFDPNAEAVSQDERDALAAKLSSTEVTQHLDAGKVAEAREGILEASIDQLVARLGVEFEGLAGERVLQAADVILEELQIHLDLQDTQIKADRKAVKARRLSGVAAAAVFAGTGPIIEHVIHLFQGAPAYHAPGPGDHPGTEAAGHPGGGPGGTPPAEAATTIHQPVETHSPNGYNPNAITGADHYGAHGVAVAELKSGETTHDMASHILRGFDGWDKFSPNERHVKIAHLAQQLAAEQHHQVGDKIRWTYEQAAGSYHFNPGVHLAHVANSHTHLGPNAGFSPDHLSHTGGGHSVSTETGNTGGTPAETGHNLVQNPTNPNFSGFHYNTNGMAEVQITKTTQPKELAKYVLSHFDGWDKFSQQDQSLKIAHFANELATQNFRVGAKVRWAYDFAQGCFNYKG